MNDLSDPSVDGRKRRRLENGARLYDAAMELMAKRTYADITVEEICAHAGVGRATFFRVYRTKADLLLEFNRRLTLRITEKLASAKPADTEQALYVMGNEIADTWTRTGPGTTALAEDFLQMAGTGDFHAAHPELLQLTVELIEAGIERGEIKEALPAGLMASLALVHLATPVSYWFQYPELHLRTLIRDAIVHWLHGFSCAKPSDRVVANRR